MDRGHGHVVSRRDGVKARCGGPATCDECATEALLMGLPGNRAVDTCARAAFDVVHERIRQVMTEGFGASRDDAYVDGELARAAVCYAHAPAGVDSLWPFALSWWKPGTRRRDLIKAAALLIAEIERIDRKERRV